mgnify:CR=1 FL=1
MSPARSSCVWWPVLFRAAVVVGSADAAHSGWAAVLSDIGRLVGYLVTLHTTSHISSVKRGREKTRGGESGGYQPLQRSPRPVYFCSVPISISCVPCGFPSFLPRKETFGTTYACLSPVLLPPMLVCTSVVKTITVVMIFQTNLRLKNKICTRSPPLSASCDPSPHTLSRSCEGRLLVLPQGTHGFKQTAPQVGLWIPSCFMYESHLNGLTFFL